MSLQRLLRLLPIGLVVLVSLTFAMLWVQHGQSRSTFDQIRVAQSQRDVLAKVRADCEALTFKAVAWTLTRRSSQGRQYQEGKAACVESVQQAERAQEQRTLWLGGLLGAMAVVVGALLVNVVTRRILFSVGEAVTVASALAEGDLGVAPRVKRDDEIGKMLAAMDQARRAWISA